VTAGFDAEIKNAVKVVHGDASLPLRPGHASGRYRSDVARWLLACLAIVRRGGHGHARPDGVARAQQRPEVGLERDPERRDEEVVPAAVAAEAARSTNVAAP
jgi:hypothetical protein